MRYRVQSGDDPRLMRDFCRVADLIYRGDPLYVRPFDRYLRLVLDPAQNPYFASATRECFVCYLDRTPVARVAITVNPAYADAGRPRALFGFFESINDREAVRALFEDASSYVRQRGLNRIEGPFNPHHYAELGMQRDRFDVPPTFFQPYNPPYYNTLMEEAGFSVAKILHTRKNPSIGATLQALRPTRLRDRDGLIARPLKARDLRSELEKIRLVYNDAFRENWAFLPVSLDEYLFNAQFLRYVTDPSLSIIVEEGGEPLGALQCVLDINPLLRQCRGRYRPLPLVRFLLGRKKVKTLVVFAVGVRHSARIRGVAALLFEAFREMAARYEAVETTWMSPENLTMIRIAERLDLRPDKQFAIYAKELRRIPEKSAAWLTSPEATQTEDRSH